MFSNPKAIVNGLGITPGMVIADVGSGSGEYSLALARAAGHSGRVYAIDVQKDLLTKLKSQAIGQGIGTIEIIWGDLEKVGGAGLADGSVDLVIVANVLFQIENKENVIKEAIRIAKPQGRIVVVEWLDSFGGLGPRPQDVVSPEEVLKMFENLRLRKSSDLKAGDHHYGLIFQKTT